MHDDRSFNQCGFVVPPCYDMHIADNGRGEIGFAVRDDTQQRSSKELQRLPA
jgi:hypothetical protein